MIEQLNSFSFFLAYHDIVTKFPPPLAVTNLCRGICGHTRWVLHFQPNFFRTHEPGIEP
jgi:hypothetical protein